MKKFIAASILFEVFICSLSANYGQASTGGSGQGQPSFGSQGTSSPSGSYSNPTGTYNSSGSYSNPTGTYNPSGAYSNPTGTYNSSNAYPNQNPAQNYNQDGYQTRTYQGTQPSSQGDNYPSNSRSTQGTYSQPPQPQEYNRSPLADAYSDGSSRAYNNNNYNHNHAANENAANLKADPKYPNDRFKTEDDHSINKKIRGQITGWFSDHFKDIVITTADGVVVIDGFVDNVEDQKTLNDELKKINDVRSVTNNVQVKHDARK
jgi:hypothetical protein